MSYLDQNSSQTLREAFDEFRGINADAFAKRYSSDKADRFFEMHDLTHVVFGQDTSLDGEATVKMWTIFGTTASALDFWRHRDVDELDGLRSAFTPLEVIKLAARYLPVMVQIRREAKKLKALWPAWEYEAYWDRSLSDIRAEFGIQIDAVRLEGPSPQPGNWMPHHEAAG